MERTMILQKVQDIFRENFDDESIVLYDHTSSKDIEDWDSYEQINLLVTIENEFGIRFNMNETKGLKNVGEMIDLIMKLL